MAIQDPSLLPYNYSTSPYGLRILFQLANGEREDGDLRKGASEELWFRNEIHSFTYR